MKVYEKPRVYIERFELSQHIAACAWDMSNAKDINNCSATADSSWGYPEDVKAFSNQSQVCDYDVESYCYTNGNANMNIFNS